MREFSTRLNALAQYAPGLASTNKGKIEIFPNKLRLDIVKEVLTSVDPPRSYTKALGKA